MYRKQKKKNSVIVAVSVVGLAHGGVALAAPSDHDVVRGDATITSSTLETLITQTSSKAVINWGSFDIAVEEMVKFVQNDANAIALNRVTGGGGASQILGSLNANGNVFLINPNGILFGSQAKIDVAGLLATTFDIDDDAFMAGNFQFTQNGLSTAAIENRGTITVGDNGFVYLIAPDVKNSGTIVANLGKVRLANDGSYTLDLAGTNLINFTVAPELIEQGMVGAIANSGDISGQAVALGAGMASTIMSSVVNTGNITAATSLTMAGNRIEQSGAITADSAELTSTGAITTNGSGVIKAGETTLKAASGIGTQANAIRTETEHLDVTLAGNTGGIYIEEKDGLDSLKIDTANRPVSVDFDEADENTLRLEFDANSKLSTTDTVNGEIDFTNRSGGVTLSGIAASDLRVTAEGNIVSDTAHAGSTATASNLYLEVTGEGSTIGREGQTLRVDAGTLNAHASRGHIVVTDVAGGVALNEIDTGSNSAEDGLRAIMQAKNGSITSGNTATANVTAWATNLEADGAIGTSDRAITTRVDVLNASTQDGGIHVEDQQGQLVVGDVTARERITVGGQTVSSTALSNPSGQITLSDGTTVGQHDVSIRSQGDMFLTGAVSATDALAIESRQGAIMAIGDSASLMGRTIGLSADDQIGVDGASLRTQSNLLNASSGNGGIFVTEGNGMTMDHIVAHGDNNAVKLSATQGDIQLGLIDAEGGQVSVESVNGRILDNNGAALNVRADAVAFSAKGAIGSASNRIDTDTSALTTRTRDQGVGTFIDNIGTAEALNATTNRGNVAIANANGTLAFNGSSGQLTLANGGMPSELDLDFANTGGDIILDTLNVGDNSARLNASGSISQGAGALLTARSATLQAGRHIGSGAQAVRSDASSLDLTTANGDIFVENVSAERLLLNAQAAGSGESGSVSVTHAGDMAVGSINSRRSTSLRADGVIEGADDSDGYRVTANSMSLEADAIGSAARVFSTRATGNVSLKAREGDIYLLNLGAMQLVDAEAAGQVELANHGDLILGRLAAGEDVQLSVQGRVTNGNGGGLNISARGLKVNATQFGAANDAIEMLVDNLVIDTSNGGIYAYQNGVSPLNLRRAQASGSGSDIHIGADGDIALGTVSAAGNRVELRSGGSIEDARDNGATAPNVRAKSLEISAEQGVGANGDLALDVSFLSASGGAGDVNASNLGAIAVDSDTLAGKGAAGVSIIATSITILDNKGGVITMDGGRLVLTATNGNIVFLNQSDTIHLPGGGSITLTALSKSEMDGYRGSIIVGNLTTDGGDITLNAESNITIGMLDALGAAHQAGDVWVESRNGVILDGNGTHANIRGDHVTLIANTPGHREAELVRDTAIAEYSARVAEANAKASVLEILEQQLQSHIVMAENAAVLQGIAKFNQTTKQYEVDRAAKDVAEAQKVVDALNTTLNALTVVRNAAAIVTGAMQAVPFSGDGGADAAFAVVDLYMSVAAMALDEYERYSLSPKVNALDSLNNELDQAIANLYGATNLLNHANDLSDTTQESRDIADLAHFNAVVARDASQQLRRQAVAAYDLNQDIDMSAAKPLGIEANRVNMRTSDDRVLNSGVYLNSQGTLGLGDIASKGEVRVTDVVGDLSIVGEVTSPTSITLQTGGAIQGAGGTWKNGQRVPTSGQLIAPDLIAVAGSGVGMDQAVNARVERLAANAGNGGASLLNRNDGRALEVTTLDNVVGISGNGDITLDSDGDLVLKAGIRDTDTDSQHTIALSSGGEIIDANDTGRNVEAHRVVASAVKSIELDTATADLTATVSGSGNIMIREHDDLFLNNLSADNISVRAGGNVEVGAVSADTDTGTVTLNAGGRIDDDEVDATRIQADRLVMTAGGAIGGTGSDANRSLDTDVKRLSALAVGDTNIQEQNDLLIESLVTTGGNVTVQSLAGSLEVGRIATGTVQDTITLLADGGINAAGEAPINLTGANLALRAGAGIGNQAALNVNADRLEADSGFGGIEINDHSGDLVFGGVTPNLSHASLNGLDAYAGGLRVAALKGELRIEEAVNQGIRLLRLAKEQAPGGVFLSGASGVVQAADIISSDGRVNVIAGDGDIVMQNGTQTLASRGIDYSAGDNLDLQTLNTEGGDVSLAAGGDLAQNADITATGGKLNASVDGHIVMARGTQTQSGTGIDYETGKGQALHTLTAQSGDVTLDAGEAIDQQASIVAHAGNVTASAGTDLVMAQGAATKASGGINYSTVNDMALQRIAAEAGDVILAAGGSLSQNAAVTTAHGGIAAEAGEDLTMAQGSWSVAGNAVEYSADRDLTLRRIDSQGGGVALDAGRNLTQHGEISAAQGVTAEAGGNLTMAVGTHTTAGSGMAYEAGDDLSLQRLATQTGDISLEAGRKIVQNGTVTTGQGGVSVSAGQDIVMAQGSRTEATGAVSYAAGNALHITEIASNAVDFETAKGAITSESSVTRNVTASRLVASAANGIGALTSALKTQVERLSASLAGSGSIYINEADAVELTRVANANGNVQVTAGGNITVQGVKAQNGRVSLDSTGQVRTTEQGSIEAKELNVAASRGIDVNTQVGKATVSVAQAGGIKVRETDTIDLTSVTTTLGNIDVSAGGRIGVNSVQAGGEGSTVRLTTGAEVVQTRPAQAVGSALVGETVTLQAARGIGTGSGDVLTIDTDRLLARTQTGNVQVDLANSVRLDELSSGQGNIAAIVRQGDAVVGKVSTGGNISLTTAEGSMRDDGKSNTRISGYGVTLTGKNGIGGAGASLQTEVNSLTATVAGHGDIVISERTGLSRLNASTANGDIVVRTLNGEMGVDRVNARGESSLVSLQANNGGIRDANDDSRSNITADRLALEATNGIGRANNALDIEVARLVANGGAGGVYLNNLSDALALGLQGAELNTLQARGSNVVLTTAGDLSISGDVVNTGNGDIRLGARGDVHQTGNITANRSGDINIAGGGRVEMSPQASTTTGRGNIRYAAGEALAVSNITTANDLNGGRVTLQAPALSSTADKAAGVKGGFIEIEVPSSVTPLLQQLVGSAAAQSRVSLNNRMVGGKLSNDRSFIDDLLLPSTMSSAKTSGVVSMANLSSFFSTEGLQTTAFSSDEQGDMWIFQP